MLWKEQGVNHQLSIRKVTYGVHASSHLHPEQASSQKQPDCKKSSETVGVFPLHIYCAFQKSIKHSYTDKPFLL